MVDVGYGAESILDAALAPSKVTLFSRQRDSCPLPASAYARSKTLTNKLQGSWFLARPACPTRIVCMQEHDHRQVAPSRGTKEFSSTGKNSWDAETGCLYLAGIEIERSTSCSISWGPVSTRELGQWSATVSETLRGAPHRGVQNSMAWLQTLPNSSTSHLYPQSDLQPAPRRQAAASGSTPCLVSAIR